MKLDLEKIDLMRYLRRRPSEEEKHYGTFNRRQMAALIDSLILMIVVTPLIEYFYAQYYSAPTVNSQEIVARVREQAASTVGAISIFMREMEASGHWEKFVVTTKWMYYAYAVYSIICWHYWSATPGKIICRLKIIDSKTGGKMGEWQSILRVLGYLLSALPLGLGFFWIGMNQKRRGWHDLLAGTEVVRVGKDVERKGNEALEE